MTGERSTKVPKGKVEAVKKLADQIKNSRTMLLASCKGLPGGKFHDIKKKLRGVAEIRFLKKNAVLRAIDASGKKVLEGIKPQLGSDFAIFFSEMDAFSLSGLLTESQIPSKAKAGDIAPEDIEIQPGPTDLVPGPAISELSGVGLKVAVKEGKLEILKGAIVAKQGEPVKENVASVLSKLGINPMKVGFIPIAAYDSHDDKVYTHIIIDKAGTLDELKESIKRALGFAVSRDYATTDTIKFFLAKASMEEKAIGNLITNTKEGN